MCNDKQGMGAPPKPKQPAVSQLLDNQQEFNLSKLIKNSIKLILRYFVADNGLQAVPGLQNLLSCYSSHI